MAEKEIGSVKKKSIIHILCNDGSQIGVTPKTIYGDGFQVGVGGAELALLTLAEYWTKIGHNVVLYNNPREKTKELDQRHISSFNPQENRDYLIIFRSPNERANKAKGKKIWWSCDQYSVGNFAEFGKQVDQIVTISPRHREFFLEPQPRGSGYGLSSTPIDLPVREQDYLTDIEKVPYRLLFSSVPSRGLDILAQCYPHIKNTIPEASLVITSDFRLWGDHPPGDMRSIFFGQKDVIYLGATPRKRLVEEQYKADILAYPSSYDELFCIACAEAQWCGALPITTTEGALPTTNMGIKVEGDYRSPYWIKQFVQTVCEHLADRETLKHNQSYVKKKARERFNLDTIHAQWEFRVFD